MLVSFMICSCVTLFNKVFILISFQNRFASYFSFNMQAYSKELSLSVS